MTSARLDEATRTAADAAARAALEALEQIAQGGPVPAADPELSRLVAALDAKLWAAVEAEGDRG